MQTTSNLTLLTPAEIKAHALLLYEYGVRKFKIVGGEPTLRRDLPDIITELRSIDATIDISMVTNGTRLSKNVTAYRDAGLNRVNVSLFSLNDAYFRTHVGPLHLLHQSIAGIDAAIGAGIAGKINHVYHDREDLAATLNFARERGLRINVLNQIASLSSPQHTPIGELLAILEELPIASRSQEDDPYSLPVTVLRLTDGTEIEVKHLEVGAQEKFASCVDCSVRSICQEGIFALRITPEAKLQPCIVRDDNTLDLASTATVEALRQYLDAL